MASFSDNVTKGMFPVVEKTMGSVGITCELNRLLYGAKQTFDLPETSNLCIRCVRPMGAHNKISDRSWETAFQRASDVINQIIFGGLHPLSATWLGGTEVRHLVLKQEPLEEGLLQESSKIQVAYTKLVASALIAKLDSDASIKLPTDTSIRILLIPHTSTHRKRMLRQIHDVINSELGGVVPVKCTITEQGNLIFLTFGTHSVNEGLLQESPKILNHLAQQLFTNFKYAEESYFEESGKRPPYTLKFMPADDIRKMPVIRMDLDRVHPIGVTGPGWNEAKARLKTMADEFILDEGGLFDITVSNVRGIGFYYISLFQNKD